MTTAKQRKHPKGLPYLFLSEMWERFGYYLMIGIFTFYLKDEVASGGFGMTEARPICTERLSHWFSLRRSSVDYWRIACSAIACRSRSEVS
jgi:hypothetical protein